jgi:hypothetical protein
MKFIIAAIVALLISVSVYAYCGHYKQCCNYQGYCIVVCSTDMCPMDFPNPRY